MLHRRDDESHEFREVILCENVPVPGHWAVVEQVGFLSMSDTFKRTQLHHGWERDSRLFFEEEINRLCKEGFYECEADPPKA